MWRLAEDVAQFEMSPLSARVDLNQPDRGLARIAIDGVAISGTRLLGVRLASSSGETKLQLQEGYVRRDDLIAGYMTCGSRSIEIRLDWQSLSDAKDTAVGVEAILSVQTDLLDSDPAATIGSRVAADEILGLDSSGELFRTLEIDSVQPLRLDRDLTRGALLFRLPTVSYSYLEMIHPADFEEIKLSRDLANESTFESRFLLFRESLEKGVIRRGRTRGLILPRENDTEIAARCYQAFLESEVPLGT